MKAGVKFVGIIWTWVLGFFVMLFFAFILQKTSIWFSIPFLMDQNYSFFVFSLIFFSLLYLYTQIPQKIDEELKDIIKNKNKEDKEDYEIAMLFVKPFLKAFLYLVAFCIVYIYYLILV
jgi:flagellar biosynthesis protein FlhB